MHTDTLEAVQLGDTTQWIRTRGADPTNPVLLLIQQGPGLPMINEVRRFERALGLEEDFTVVYWDQRGCGRSLRAANTGAEISVDLMVGDTLSLLEILKDRFGKRAYVAGFSLGATIGLYAAAQRPDLVETLIAVGPDIDGVAAGNSAYDFALDVARQRGNKRAIRQLESIGPPPHLDAKRFGTRVRWASNFGGVTHDQSYGARGADPAGQPRSLIGLLGWGCAPNRSWDHRHPGRTVAGDGRTGSRQNGVSPGRAARHGPRSLGPGRSRRSSPTVLRHR